MTHRHPILALMLVCTLAMTARAGVPHADPRHIKPDAMADLATDEGAALVGAQWRWREATIVDSTHRAAGPDLRASGEPVRTHDVSPRGDALSESGWTPIAPAGLLERRGSGKLSFAWYAVDLTLPAMLGQHALAGSTVAFEITVDDYAEIWVNGRQPLVLGQRGGGAIGGFNTPSRVLLTRDAKPGQTFSIRIFAANGPLSRPPGNFIWVRSAALLAFAPGRGIGMEPAEVHIDRVDPAIDQIIHPGTTLEHLASGFGFTEGPVWVPASDQHDGHLLFSDPNHNNIWRWSPEGDVSIFRAHSGYSGADVGRYRQPGSNGLALDAEGRLTICEHGNRRVTRIERTGQVTVLADRYDGKRLNSPNDLVYRSDGALFFTDPFFGLPGFGEDPARELPFTGVFCLLNGQLKLVSTDLTGPNGIAFSPDEKHLYVANWDEQRKIVMRYDCQPDGTLTNGIVFFDMTAAAGEEALDGIKVDRAGNLFVSGPGGVWVLSKDARHLGTLRTPELAANMAWGDNDLKTLYLTARTGVYRLPTLTGGVAR